MTILKRSSALFITLIALVLSLGIIAQTTGALNTAEQTYQDIYADVAPSVVAISVETAQGGGGGTGFVIDTDGHIVTNYHVVGEAREIIVSFFDGTLARAETVGLDPDSDLAVIRVDDVPAERLIPVRFGDSEALQVGDEVLAIGSPFGERWTLTTGIVSALDRTIRGLNNFSIGGAIQTDAAINPGNSGGPLLNSSGDVIGVNSQIISASGSSAGIGFAVPGNLTQRVARTLIETGDVEYSYLGISGGNVTLDLIDALNLPNNTQGVVVGTVEENGSAALAGIQPAELEVMASETPAAPQRVDIITAINGTPITGMDSLVSFLAQKTQPGDTITLTVLRNGTDTLQLTTTLQARPE